MAHSMLKNTTLRKIFVSIIVLLAGSATYLYFFHPTKDPINQTLLAQFGHYDKELVLQNVPENSTSGSLRVPILVYHSMAPHGPNQSTLQRYYDVAPEAFEKQMQYLKDNNYTVISLDLLARALDQGAVLPTKAVVLTFDDGWRSQYFYAFPVLQKYGYTATFFIFSHAIGTDRFLTWDQVRRMNTGGMTIGGHTETHPYLPSVHDPVALQREIAGGKQAIEDQIHQPIDLFAYPFGHYTDAVIAAVKQAGFIAARSTYKGINNAKGDLYTLKSVEVSDDFDAFVKAVQN